MVHLLTSFSIVLHLERQPKRLETKKSRNEAEREDMVG